jgi:hypothetical protein
MRKLFGVVFGLSLVVLGLSAPVSAGPNSCLKYCSTEFQNCYPYFPSVECEAAYDACVCGCDASCS